MYTTKFRNFIAPSLVSKDFLHDFISREVPSGGNIKKTFRPSVNIRETDEKFVIDLLAPGFDKADFNIEIEKNSLNVSAEMKKEDAQENEKMTRREFSFGSFSTSFSLPDLADRELITASYDKGILSVTILKKPEVTKNKIKQVEVA